jgi:hypothetical protein
MVCSCGVWLRGTGWYGAKGPSGTKPGVVVVNLRGGRGTRDTCSRIPKNWIPKAWIAVARSVRPGGNTNPPEYHDGTAELRPFPHGFHGSILVRGSDNSGGTGAFRNHPARSRSTDELRKLIPNGLHKATLPKGTDKSACNRSYVENPAKPPAAAAKGISRQ